MHFKGSRNRESRTLASRSTGENSHINSCLDPSK